MTKHDNLNEIKLLKSSAAGDSGAFEGLVVKYQSLVCAITYSGTGNVAVSEELAQEAFVKAWKGLGGLRELGKFKWWICSIARTTVKDHFRKEQKDVIRSAAPIDAVDQSAIAAYESDDDALAAERMVVVEQALKRIPEKYREVIVLFYREEQSIREVAGLLELSEDAVKQRLSRGRKMLREQASEMIETTISRTGPSKAFTACVMGSVGALGLKGAASAGAVSAGVGAVGSSSSGVAGGLSAVFGTVVGKVVTAAAVLTIAVGGAVVYNNVKSFSAGKENKPVVQNDRRVTEPNENSTVGGVAKVEGGNGGPLDSASVAGEPNGTVAVAGADEVRGVVAAEIPEVEKGPQYVDPNSLTDIYLKHSIVRSSTKYLSWEFWVQEPGRWHFSQANTTTSISDGKSLLILDNQKKTAQLSDSIDGRPEFQAKIIHLLVKLGADLISGRGPDEDIKRMFHAEKDTKYYLDKEGSSDKVKLYHLITGKDFPKELYIDAKTGLLQTFKMTRSSGGTVMVFDFDYSVIADSVFAHRIPEGYKELVDKMPPTFQGWVFDKDLKPVKDAQVYVFGDRSTFAVGEGNSNGEFNFNIPVTSVGGRDPLRYPLFVRAVSKSHPGLVAWTVIKSPGDKKKLPGFVPASSEVALESKNGKCYSASGVSLVLEDGAVVSGRVFDVRTKKPVKNAEVTLNASSDGVFSYISRHYSRGGLKVKTDSKGEYVFESVPRFAWPAVKEGQKAGSDDSGESVVGVTVTAGRDGYFYENKGFSLKSEGFAERQVDVSLMPANVTVKGKVVDENGEPIVGYVVGAYHKDQNGHLTRRNSPKRINEKGEFELTGGACDESLSVKVIGTDKADWDYNELTKDKKFRYFPDKVMPVGFVEGKLEYEIEVVVEMPKVSVVFEVKDTAGNPIAGMPVMLRDDYHGDGRVLNHNWVQSLWGVTDKDGKYVINGLPERDHLSFDIRPSFHNVRKPVDDEEKEHRKSLAKYQRVHCQLQKMPVDKKGYIVEVTMPEKGESFDRDKRVKLFDSDGNEIKYFDKMR